MGRGIDRRTFLAAGSAAVLGLSGCAGRNIRGADAAGSDDATGGDAISGDATGGDGTDGGRAPTDGTGDASASGEWPTPENPPASVPLRDRRLPVQWAASHLREEIVPGGPPKDGIPSIDDPTFESTDEADEWLDPGDVVFGVVRGGDVRAYPQRILVSHEIVNDTVDGAPVAVTYCPLTGTAMGFERGTTTFGVSGKLLNSNLVMYDRATDSRWPQVLATAVSGPYAGASLREFPVTWTTYGRWKSVHPETAVLSRDTGFARNYARDPYGQYNPIGGYYDSERLFFSPLTVDGGDRMPVKATVVGVRVDGAVVAFEKAGLREAGVRSTGGGGREYLAAYDPSLDAAHVYERPAATSVEWVGAGGDDGSGETPRATVRVDGEAHRPDDLPLPRVLDLDAMWFAWYGFSPDSALVR
mgnify:CR=1 FL=1